MHTPDFWNQRGAGKLPGHLGIVVTLATPDRMQAELPVQPHLLAPNGFLHAGSVVTLADTLCGYGCLLNLPEGASGFTTIELKSNHLGTTLEGALAVVASRLGSSSLAPRASSRRRNPVTPSAPPSTKPSSARRPARPRPSCSA